MSFNAKLSEVKRHTEAQSARCKSLLLKLKTIQLQELEEYGEQQLENVISIIADNKGVELKEATVPDFLVKKKPPVIKKEFFDEDEDLADARAVDTPSPPFNSKLGHEEVTDVAQMMRKNIKETLFSTLPLGKDADETDSESDYEDDVELRASCKFRRDQEQDFKGYLPVECNPATKWARVRHETVTRYAWLTDALRHINIRMNEQDELIRQIRLTKPKFQFDEKIDTRKVPIVSSGGLGLVADINKTTQINVFHGGETPGSGTSLSVRRAIVQGVGQTGPSEEVAQIGVGCLNRGGVGGGLEYLRLTFGSDEEEPVGDPTARRCMPMLSFRQRKMYQLGGIHNVIGKPLRKPSAMCSCYGRTELCAVCSGRSDKVKPVRNGAMTKNEICALLDHTYHKIASTSDEKPLRLLMESSLKTEEWNKPPSRKQRLMWGDDTDYLETDEEKMDEEPFYSRKNSILMLPVSTVRPKQSVNPASPLKKNCRRQIFSEKKPYVTKESFGSTSTKRTRRRKQFTLQASDEEELEEFEDDDGDGTGTGSNPWTPKKSGWIGAEFKKRGRMDEKYDIDHIVIPYSIAAATRVEKIEYKEIDIPSWKNNPIKPLKRRTSRRRHNSYSNGKQDPEDEDVSPETILARHFRSEIEEKQKFLAAMHKMSNRRARRSESKADGTESRPTSPASEASEDPPSTPGKSKVEDVPVGTVAPGTPNQISAADASLAVTALAPKFSSAMAMSMSIPAFIDKEKEKRRRTISACTNETDDIEEDEETYVPFEPRKFPLSTEEYQVMVDEMEAAYAESDRIQYDNSESDLPLIKQEVNDEDGTGESEVDDPDWKAEAEMEYGGQDHDDMDLDVVEIPHGGK